MAKFNFENNRFTDYLNRTHAHVGELFGLPADTHGSLSNDNTSIQALFDGYCAYLLEKMQSHDKLADSDDSDDGIEEADKSNLEVPYYFMIRQLDIMIQYTIHSLQQNFSLSDQPRGYTYYQEKTNNANADDTYNAIAPQYHSALLEAANPPQSRAMTFNLKPIFKTTASHPDQRISNGMRTGLTLTTAVALGSLLSALLVNKLPAPAAIALFCVAALSTTAIFASAYFIRRRAYKQVMTDRAPKDRDMNELSNALSMVNKIDPLQVGADMSMRAIATAFVEPIKQAHLTQTDNAKVNAEVDVIVSNLTLNALTLQYKGQRTNKTGDANTYVANPSPRVTLG